MRSSVLRLLLISCSAVALGACSTLKAQLYVNTVVNQASDSAEVYTATEGQFLGNTPLTKAYTRRFGDPAVIYLPVVVFKDGFKPVHKVLVINKWVDDGEDPTLNANNYQIELFLSREDRHTSDIQTKVSPDSPTGGRR